MFILVKSFRTYNYYFQRTYYYNYTLYTYYILILTYKDKLNVFFFYISILHGLLITIVDKWVVIDIIITLICTYLYIKFKRNR